MSIWTDIQSRSAGEDLRNEEFSQIYTKDGKFPVSIKKNEYKNHIYEIATWGDYPYIEIIFPLEISVFSGSNKIILNDGNKQYALTRENLSKVIHFYYECNKDGDYILGKQDGHKYGLNELEQMAEKFIDLIENAEKKLINDKD